MGSDRCTRVILGLVSERRPVPPWAVQKITKLPHCRDMSSCGGCCLHLFQQLRGLSADSHVRENSNSNLNDIQYRLAHVCCLFAPRSLVHHQDQAGQDDRTGWL